MRKEKAMLNSGRSRAVGDDEEMVHVLVAFVNSINFDNQLNIIFGQFLSQFF